MKRYLTLLTVSFLSTSTLVKAGGFDIFNLPADPKEKAASLRAKASKLQENIGNTQNADLKAAFTRQQGIINKLLGAPLTEQDSDDYYGVQEQKNKIVATFFEEAKNEWHGQQSDKIDNVQRLGIYSDESREYWDLMLAQEYLVTIGDDYLSIERRRKAAGRYLKMEKLITQHVQKADKIIEVDMADVQKIKESGILNDLLTIRSGLDYGSSEYEDVDRAINHLCTIDRKDEYSLADVRNSILAYKALEKKLEPHLNPYRQSKQEAPALLSSALSGDYAKLEEKLHSKLRSSSSSIYDAPVPVREFVGIMEHIRGLPLLLMKLKELQPEVLKSLDTPPSLGENDGFDLDFPTSAASSSHHVAKTTFRTTGAVSFNSTFKTGVGSSIPEGWTLHDGRKGRVGEERTQENPLQVEVIENGKIKITGDIHNFYYSLPGLKDFAGQDVRFSAKVKSTVLGTRLAYIGKRGNQVNSDPHSNREGEEVLSLIFKVDSDPASLNNLYFLGGRAKEGIPPSMEISDVIFELLGEKD